MSRHPWDPAVVVSAELATRLVHGAFPDLADQAPVYIGAGWDNTAWRFGDWLFRFPRRRIARVLLSTEITVLQPLADALPLPITAPTCIGQPTDDYPYPWAGYRWLDGVTGCRTSVLRGPEAAEQLGHFLRVLHQQPSDAPLDDWRQLIRGQANKLHRTLDSLQPDVLDDVTGIRRLTDELASTPLYSGRPVLCHGDLYARHLLFQDGLISGVIDWGDVHRGDPATDLAAAIMMFDPDDRELLYATYGPISHTTLQRARFRALFSGVFQAHYAHTIGDEALLAAGRLAVQRALAQPAV